MIPSAPTSFQRSDRTYHLSDERMQVFQSLTIEERLRWVEEFATFVRIGREAMKANNHRQKVDR